MASPSFEGCFESKNEERTDPESVRPSGFAPVSYATDCSIGIGLQVFGIGH